MMTPFRLPLASGAGLLKVPLHQAMEYQSTISGTFSSSLSVGGGSG